jgi:DNA-binding transcriptional ArsR family regulator
MVEQVFSLDDVFGSLSDPTRRDILKRICKQGMSISTIAEHYKFSFAGVAKHLDVLEKAGLINKTRQGKEQIVVIEPRAIAAANNSLLDYQRLWEERLDSLDNYLKVTIEKGKKHD